MMERNEYGLTALYMPFSDMKIKKLFQFETINYNNNVQMIHKTCIRLTGMFKWNQVYIKVAIISTRIEKSE